MCLLGGSPIGKASKKFGIPKVMLDGNKLEICKNDWVNWRRRKKLLYRTCGFHQPHIHTFCENTCLECLKSQQPNGFNTETEPGDNSCITTSRKGTNSVTENQTILIVWY